jgi:hypothetical protein
VAITFIKNKRNMQSQIRYEYISIGRQETMERPTDVKMEVARMAYALFRMMTGRMCSVIMYI